jgi:hypothetical protein
MKKNWFCIWLLVSYYALSFCQTDSQALPGPAIAPVDSVQYTDSQRLYQLFRKALFPDDPEVYQSSSHPEYFVLITVRHKKTKKEREICVDAASFIKALQIERKIKQKRKKPIYFYTKALDLALKSNKRHFTFKRKKALQKLGWDVYTKQLTAKVRKELKNVGNQAIIKGMEDRLLKIIRKHFPDKENDHPTVWLCRKAYAHELLLRGYQVFNWMEIGVEK